jgi:MFS family permease
MNNAAASAAPAAQSKAVSVVLIVAAVVLSTAARTVLSPMQELVQADLGLDDNQIALLQGLALALPIVVLSFPLGRLVDRANRTRLLFYFGIACGLASLVTAVGHGFALVLVSRMVVGVCFAGIFLAALSLVADLSDAGMRGRLVMLLFLGQVVGRSASFALAGALLAHLPAMRLADWGLASFAPWRLVQGVFALIILGIASLMFVLREPPRREVGHAARGDLRAVFKEFLQYRKVLVPLLIGLSTINMADVAAEIWAVPVLTRTFHQTPIDFGGWMGLVTLIAGAGGALLGGLLADLGQRFGGRSGVVFGAILGAVVSIPGAFYPLMPSVSAFAVLFAIFLISGSCNGSAAVAAGTVLIPNEIRGVVSGVFGAISMLVASGIAPLLVSATAQVAGLGSDVAWPLALVGCVTSVIGSIAFVVCMRAARDHPTLTEGVMTPAAPAVASGA